MMNQLKDGMTNLLRKRRALEEQTQRRSRSTTYTVPLEKSDDLKPFLMQFYKHIYDNATRDKHKTLLQQFPDTLAVHYDSLVPSQVSYEDFWQRYEYRCDLDRILKQLAEEDKKKLAENLNEAASEAAEKEQTAKEDALKLEEKRLQEEARKLDAALKQQIQPEAPVAPAAPPEDKSLSKIWKGLGKKSTSADDQAIRKMIVDEPVVPTRAESPSVTRKEPEIEGTPKLSNTRKATEAQKANEIPEKNAPQEPRELDDSWLFSFIFIFLSIIVACVAVLAHFHGSYNFVCLPAKPLQLIEAPVDATGSWIGIDFACPSSSIKFSNGKLSVSIQDKIVVKEKGVESFQLNFEGVLIKTKKKEFVKELQWFETEQE